MSSLCHWWIGYLLVNPIRRWFQNPGKLLSPYVKPGAVVLEPGPGMGFFSLEMARLVGPQGRVIVVDIQSKMLQALARRATKAGLRERIDTRQATSASLRIDDLAQVADFVLAFYVVHEMPDAAHFFAQTAAAMKPGARMLFVEPPGHVSQARFREELAAAVDNGLVPLSPPAKNGFSVVLEKR